MRWVRLLVVAMVCCSVSCAGQGVGGGDRVGGDAAAAAAESHPPSTAPATEIRRGVEMSGTPEQRAARFYDALVEKIEPGGAGEAARLPGYMDFFRREFVEDPRMFAMELRAIAGPDGSVDLRGFVEYPEHAAAAAAFLGRLGFDRIRDSAERLPAADLGPAPRAVVTADRCFLYDKPADAPRRETLTECVAGDRLFLLREAAGDTLLCHGPDGYVGYVDARHVRRVGSDARTGGSATRNPATAAASEDAGGRGPSASAPAAATSASGERHGAAAAAAAAAGVGGFPGQGSATSTTEPSDVDPRVERQIEAAMRLLGTPYVWGGTTAAGVDCSGLVQSSFKSLGLHLPRDADQQSLGGRLVATRWHRDDLRRGDLLYFLSSRGSIHHTAIYLGDGRFLEAGDPGVIVSSFRPGDPGYAPKRAASFCFAKRIFER